MEQLESRELPGSLDLSLVMPATMRAGDTVQAQLVAKAQTPSNGSGLFVQYDPAAFQVQAQPNNSADLTGTSPFFVGHVTAADVPSWVYAMPANREAIYCIWVDINSGWQGGSVSFDVKALQGFTGGTIGIVAPDTVQSPYTIVTSHDVNVGVSAPALKPATINPASLAQFFALKKGPFDL